MRPDDRSRGLWGALARRVMARLFDIVDRKEGIRGRRSPGGQLWLDTNWDSGANAYPKCYALFYAFVSGT